MNAKPRVADPFASLRWLGETPPGLLGPVVPLVIGAYEALAARLAPDVPAADLQTALRRHCGHFGYLRAMAAPGSCRHDIDGRAVAAVDDSARAAALARLDDAIARRQKRHAATSAKIAQHQAAWAQRTAARPPVASPAPRQRGPQTRAVAPSPPRTIAVEKRKLAAPSRTVAAYPAHRWSRKAEPSLHTRKDDR